jgi:predicted acyl esterase
LVLDPVTAAESGYIVVVQDVRGRYRSKGEFVPFVVYATPARREVYSANIGTYGSRYSGQRQHYFRRIVL